MARRTPPSTRARRRRGVLRHYDRPLVTDRLFWLVALPSSAVTALAVGVLIAIWGTPEGSTGWVRLVLVGLLVLWLSFRLLGTGVLATRHLQRGLGEGSHRRDAYLETTGRAAGVLVGRAMKARQRAGSVDSLPAPSGSADAVDAGAPGDPAPAPGDSSPAPPTADEPPSSGRPDVTADRAARVAGAMVGRRLAERRRRKS